MFKHFLWPILLTTISINKAQALVFIEPLVGYSTGKLSINASALLENVSLSDELDIKGLNYGLRAGLELGNWQLAADYIQNDLKASSGSFDLGDADEFKTKELAGLLGYRFWFFRLYGGLIFQVDAEDSDFDSGTGVKAGLSFYALRNMALSLEYRTVELPEYFTDDGILIGADYTQIAFLASFPFSF